MASIDLLPAIFLLRDRASVPATRKRLELGRLLVQFGKRALCGTLPNDNAFEMRLKKPVSKEDFERIKKLVELSEASLVSG